MIHLENVVLIEEKEYNFDNRKSFRYEVATPENGRFSFYTPEKMNLPMGRFSLVAKIKFYNGKSGLSLNLSDIKIKEN